MKNSATKKVRISATGKDQSSPSNPMNIGMSMGRNTPSITSREREIRVDYTALPSACKKMNVPLLIVAGIIMQR